MKRTILCLIATVALVSCQSVTSSKNEASPIPKPAASADAVKAEIKNKEYVVNDVGTVDFFDTAKLEWSSTSADTSKFFKDYIAERKGFVLRFINDSAAQITDEKKAIAASYAVEKDSTGMLLQLKYADSSFSFNPGEMMMITTTFKIRGMDGNGLLLETPREINRRKVVVLMKKK